MGAGELKKVEAIRPDLANLTGAHLLDKGKKPACVAACEMVKAKALVVGNLNDPDSEVSKLMANNPVRGIREDLGTEPKVYYIGL